MWKFVLRNNNKKKGKVLATVYNAEVLKSAIMSIEEKIFNGQIKVSSEDFIDLERNNLCHTIKGSRGHDKIWKDATKKMNEMFGYNISRTDTAEQLGVKLKHEKYKHIFKCTNCGLVYYRAKNIYELKRCRCGKCNAKALIRIK